MRALLATDTDSDARDADGNTPLMLSFKHNNTVSAIQFLSQKVPAGFMGAPASAPDTVDLSLANKLGQTVFHLHFGSMNLDRHKYLLELAQIDDCRRPDANGLSPFHYLLINPLGKELCRLVLQKFGALMGDEVH